MTKLTAFALSPLPHLHRLRLQNRSPRSGTTLYPCRFARLSRGNQWPASRHRATIHVARLYGFNRSPDPPHPSVLLSRRQASSSMASNRHRSSNPESRHHPRHRPPRQRRRYELTTASSSHVHPRILGPSDRPEGRRGPSCEASDKVADDLPVLVVAQELDPHADVVEAAMAASGITFARTSLDSWCRDVVEWWSSGQLLLRIGSANWLVGDHTTVWWRRPGQFYSSALGTAELHLAQDESAVMLPGALDSAGVRWVDQPWTTVRAGNRLVQLKLATNLGANPPLSLVTNSASVAADFVAAGPALAKTISTGRGLAPFAARIDHGDTALVRNAPVMLQRVIAGDADWRLVTVSKDCFGWRRERRASENLDWRADDPGGAAFRASSIPTDVAGLANALQDELGLSFSVQDWIEVNGQWFFLEVNPQGQWLFLEDAGARVSPALACHLGGTIQR